MTRSQVHTKSENSGTKIQWANPPTQKRATNTSGRMIEFVNVLKTRPNTWAIYDKKYRNQSVVSIAKKRFPHTEWTSRINADGKTFTIYGRFVK